MMESELLLYGGEMRLKGKKHVFWTLPLTQNDITQKKIYTYIFLVLTFYKGLTAFLDFFIDL